MPSPVIFWYRQDLRSQDLPGLNAAIQTGQPLIAIYILDDEAPGEWALGGASRWWLHQSLAALHSELGELGGRLLLRRGATVSILEDLVRDTGADAVYCSRQYQPWAAQLEQELHHAMEQLEVSCKRYPGSLLWEPGTVLTKTSTAFKVFTPFWRQCKLQPSPPVPQSLPDSIHWHPDQLDSLSLASLKLCPQQPDWAADWTRYWSAGSAAAQAKLDDFLQRSLDNYSEGRDYPGLAATSRLSPHLHFGEISPRTIWHAAVRAGARQPALQAQVDKFLSELAWREFSYHLLYHFPDIPHVPFREQFAAFPWQDNKAGLAAWQAGQTGYPIVDAAMRELWQTGYMHNRMRMVAASFLTKHLLVPWGLGARWFWDTLVDADLANNSCSWQWVAGSGADAAPYFRIFNPIAQGQKFDAAGEYLRQWVPELADLPDKYLHCPWEAPAAVMTEAGVELGRDYPAPIVEHKAARETALAAYHSLKQH